MVDNYNDDDNRSKVSEIKQKVLELQDNSCANCGVDFSDDDSPRFHYLLPISQGGERSEDNVEALCGRCFSDVASYDGGDDEEFGGRGKK